ncbi:WD40 repeat domain-containing protein [Desertifilum sp. FACHB-1129]|uniref:Uncharacterized protein n=1 Tax=Desertifilum tharense IPPAS B-1220 TaxID=1781255 RepID=A0A1E5QGN8_9CYAN|nr:MULTISPECIES: WD40 repeat domain-containing protein [Desertifilum]MDA0210362.1 WD40 repeat domain-containing protein [Cyanobacteria bacterium FC1]MBD2310309.1 WD40 repeat domain-containing protein [Desertifilum sp. FACHB-1129]MBD2322685.1 WD40 repeat domain-containing protein [Desertifilum sp. FACHB-866]MBD2333563.1 WD40 repeat domain-containing protein [Desertifilum sp. FACHB-868]OEJ73757.1 hypothetical protein BH720_18175 [Desertifilum tharense IPPAS B-1220]
MKRPSLLFLLVLLSSAVQAAMLAEQRWFAQSNPTLPQPSMAAVSTASQPLRLVRTLTHTDEPVSAIAISSDRRTLIRAYPSGKIEQWDVQTGERIREMRGHTDVVQSVAISPDGRSLVSGSSDNTVRRWNLSTGQLQQTLSSDGFVRSVVFSPEGRRIAAGSQDGSVRVWDLHAGELQTFKAIAQNPEFTELSDILDAVGFAPDGEVYAVVGSADGSMSIWQPRAGERIRRWQQFRDDRVSFIPGRETVVFCQNPLQLWDFNSGEAKQLPAARAILSDCSAIATSADGQTLIAADAESLQIWELSLPAATVTTEPSCTPVAMRPLEESGELPNADRLLYRLPLPLEEPSTAGWDALRFNGDRTLFVQAGVGVRLWDLSTNQLVCSFGQDSSQIADAVFTSTLRPRLITAHRDSTLKVWNPLTGEALRVLRGHQDAVSAIALNADSSSLASSSVDQTVKLWNWETGELEKTLTGHRLPVRDIAYSPDGKLLASISESEAKIWESETGRLLQTFNLKSIQPAITFNDRGDAIATDGNQGSTYRLEVATGKLHRLLSSNLWQDVGIQSAILSPNGQYLVVNTFAYPSLEVRNELWDLTTQTRISYLDTDYQCGGIVGFSPDSQMLVCAGQEMQIWQSP